MPHRSSERQAIVRDTRVLRALFLAGAVTDAVALLSMLLPSLATLLWGLRVVGGIVVSEIAGAVVGVVDAWPVVPTRCLQAILLVLFAWAS